MRFKRCGGFIDGVYMRLLIVIAELGVRNHVGVRASTRAGASNKIVSAKIINRGCNCQISPLNITCYIEERSRVLFFFFLSFSFFFPLR
jgi:hypothetical protein